MKRAYLQAEPAIADYVGEVDKRMAMAARLKAAEPAITDTEWPDYSIELLGKRNGLYSVWVNGNWRIVFQFDENNAIAVDYLDYH